ncbi:NAD(P)-dependent oxidoreductase [Aromatoleum toluclasticum]|uniref:NAD(P)-dependent oxidoreductase n=1 Tax=Aromatoleum toluclasticum TaxID=92003 RepID=UPI001D184AA7|nr:NAD(P)-dependent oxidoreductase [Aromatoleum toluclasticum]MCC4118476.1 NAD(P)-dependent oxidoreductase [Aromatoleum toluclasticum]
MTDANTRIGWVGLGKMGTPMAANLLAEGYSLRVFNRSPEKAKLLVDKGARFVPSLADLAAECDVVLSTVADDRALLDVTTSLNGLFHGAQAGLIYIDMSTVSPHTSARLASEAAACGILYLRAPVSGSVSAASAATLTILCSGPREAFDRCAGLLKHLATKLYYLGEAEQARYLKLSINMMLGITAAMLGEALALGERGGLEWRQMVEVVNNSAVASPLIGYKARMLSTRDFAPMFTMSQLAKDFDLALDAGRMGNIPMPLTALVRQFVSAMIASGRGELDFFAYVTLLEELAGLSGSTMATADEIA